MNWQGAQIIYNLISDYSAVCKESFVSKEQDSFGFATRYLLTEIFFSCTVIPREEMEVYISSYCTKFSLDKGGRMRDIH